MKRFLVLIATILLLGAGRFTFIFDGLANVNVYRAIPAKGH